MIYSIRAVLASALNPYTASTSPTSADIIARQSDAQPCPNSSSGAPCYAPGLLVDTKRCNATAADRLQHMIPDIRNFAQGALKAIDSQPSLYNYFFAADDRDTVRTVFNNIESYTKNQVKTITFTCGDPANRCWRKIIAYCNPPPVPESPVYAINFCPYYQKLPYKPEPCDKTYLGMSIGVGHNRIRTVLHELMHVAGTGGSAQPIIQDMAYGAYDSHNLVTKENPRNATQNPELQDKQPSNNADSYSLFAVWAYILSRQQLDCPSSYPLWNVLTDVGGITKVGSGSVSRMQGTPVTGQGND